MTDGKVDTSREAVAAMVARAALPIHPYDADALLSQVAAELSQVAAERDEARAALNEFRDAVWTALDPTSPIYDADDANTVRHVADFRERADTASRQLAERDKFIVDRGLWMDFVGSLSASPPDLPLPTTERNSDGG